MNFSLSRDGEDDFNACWTSARERHRDANLFRTFRDAKIIVSNIVWYAHMYRIEYETCQTTECPFEHLQRLGMARFIWHRTLSNLRENIRDYFKHSTPRYSPRLSSLSSKIACGLVDSSIQREIFSGTPRLKRYHQPNNSAVSIKASKLRSFMIFIKYITFVYFKHFILLFTWYSYDATCDNRDILSQTCLWRF